MYFCQGKGRGSLYSSVGVQGDEQGLGYGGYHVYIGHLWCLESSRYIYGDSGTTCGGGWY